MIYQQVTSIKSLGTGDKVKIKSPFTCPLRERCVKTVLTGCVGSLSDDGVSIVLDKPLPNGSTIRVFSALMVSKGYIWVKQ